MVQNPMDLFSKRSPKVDTEAAPKPKVEREPLVLQEGEKPQLPDNWRERVNEAVDFLTQMQDYGSKVPQMYNMTEEEFTRFMDDPNNFSKEDWDLMQQARKEMRHFVEEMKQTLKDHQIPKKPKRKMPPAMRRWISVD